MTDDLADYLREIIPQARVECAGCGVERDAVDTVIWANKFYCTDECADRHLAPLRKPQPKGVQLNGWDI